MHADLVFDGQQCFGMLRSVLDRHNGVGWSPQLPSDETIEIFYLRLYRITFYLEFCSLNVILDLFLLEAPIVTCHGSLVAHTIFSLTLTQNMPDSMNSILRSNLPTNAPHILSMSLTGHYPKSLL